MKILNRVKYLVLFSLIAISQTSAFANDSLKDELIKAQQEIIRLQQEINRLQNGKIVLNMIGKRDTNCAMVANLLHNWAGENGVSASTECWSEGYGDTLRYYGRIIVKP